MKRVIILALCLMALSMPTFASNWYWVGSDKSGTQWFIDNDSVSKDYSDGYATIWVKLNKSDGTSIKSSLQVLMNRRIRIIDAYGYDKNGDFIAGANVTTSFFEIPPDSIDEVIYYLVWGHNNSYSNHDASAYTPFR